MLAFVLNPDGRLSPAGSISTRGLGSGTLLKSEGAVVLSADGNWLYAVNAGSNELSVFRADGARPVLVDTASTGGDTPTSVTVHDRWVYVLNAGGSGSIRGFERDDGGHLTAMPGSGLPLSGGGTDPAEIAFAPDGTWLVVSEKAANRLIAYRVDGAGLAEGPIVTRSVGETPFGFEFAPDETLVVAEAFAAAPDASAVSSYRFLSSGRLQPLSRSIPTTETAACWVAITPDGRFAYTTNNGSASVSGFKLATDGTLQILDGSGVSGRTGPNSEPTDVEVSRDGRFLYVLDSGSHSLAILHIADDGTLVRDLRFPDLPVSTMGLASR